MNKIPRCAPPTGLAGAPLLPLLPQLWYLIHSCSLPDVMYYFIFDLYVTFINHSTFLLCLSLVVVGGGSK